MSYDLSPDLPPDDELFHPVDDHSDAREELPQVSDSPDNVAELPPLCRSAQIRASSYRMTEKGMQSLAQEDPVFTAEYYEQQMISEYQTEVDMDDLIAFAAKMDPDTMYYHQAIREPDSAEFIQAMVTEINGHIEGKHWELVPMSE
eukprot:12541226-Ditylum_brightwellii.AAC.1